MPEQFQLLIGLRRDTGGKNAPGHQLVIAEALIAHQINLIVWVNLLMMLINSGRCSNLNLTVHHIPQAIGNRVPQQRYTVLQNLAIAAAATTQDGQCGSHVEEPLLPLQVVQLDLLIVPLHPKDARIKEGTLATVVHSYAMARPPLRLLLQHLLLPHFQDRYHTKDIGIMEVMQVPATHYRCIILPLLQQTHRELPM